MLKFGRAGRLVWLGRLPLESKPKAALTRLRSPVQLRPGPLNFLFFKCARKMETKWASHSPNNNLAITHY